jgi:hypothetical protein
MRGYLDRYKEAQIKSRQYDRGSPIKHKWSGDQLTGQLLIENVVWAYVEWSEKRQEWCIEDSLGRGLKHAGDLRGTADSRHAAIELAVQMIRDGRLPTPLGALERRDAERERRRQRPSEIRRRQEQQERRERSGKLSHARWDADWQERKQPPLYEALAEAFDFGDPDLWRSNSFASLRPRLVIWMQSVVAQLECDVESAIRPPSGWRGRVSAATRAAKNAHQRQELQKAEAKLARAREILGWLEDEPARRAQADRNQQHKQGEAKLAGARETLLGRRADDVPEGHAQAAE